MSPSFSERRIPFRGATWDCGAVLPLPGDASSINRARNSEQPQDDVSPSSFGLDRGIWPGSETERRQKRNKKVSRMLPYLPGVLVQTDRRGSKILEHEKGGILISEGRLSTLWHGPRASPRGFLAGSLGRGQQANGHGTKRAKPAGNNCSGASSRQGSGRTIDLGRKRTITKPITCVCLLSLPQSASLTRPKLHGTNGTSASSPNRRTRG